MVWNQNEVPQSRHLHYECWEKYDLVNDLQADISSIFTAKWHLSATSTSPLYGVFSQELGSQAWGTEAWFYPASTRPSVIILETSGRTR